MTLKSLLLFLFIFCICENHQTDFLKEQLKFSRVRTAISEQEGNLKAALNQKKITLQDLNICILAYKEESIVEVYVKRKTENTYQYFTNYNVCVLSGNLGPKRKQGDRQIPEGFYHIDRFNPSSYFYLSLGINYPNKSDKIKGHPTQPGGDIFIHGSCVSIGCLPITDEKIKALYVLAIHARNNGQVKIPVYIFPFKMTEKNMERIKQLHTGEEELWGFWKNLKTGYDKFIESAQEIKIAVDTKGNYTY